MKIRDGLGLRYTRPKGNKITVGLVAESLKRRDNECQAEHFYLSKAFSLARRWALDNCTDWGILSAKYGLLLPQDIVEPNDDTLPTNEDLFRYWSSKVAFQCYMKWGEDTLYVLLAGAGYRTPFEIWNIRGLKWETPFENMTIGDQIAWLSQELRHLG